MLPEKINSVISNSMWKDQPQEALQKPFFLGQVRYNSILEIEYTIVEEPALTDAEIDARLRDPRACRACLMIGAHDYECKFSPWKELFGESQKGQ